MTLESPFQREETEVTERELDRRVARRLAIFRYHEEGHSVALTCRRYGIARETYDKWQRRYRALGVEGLRDRSTRPHRCPFAISQEAIDKIIYLRQNYHFGPLKLSMYLKRYHQLEISVSGVWRVLRRLHLNRLPSSQRYKPHTRNAGSSTRNLSLGTVCRSTSSSFHLSPAASGSTSTRQLMTAPAFGC